MKLIYTTIPIELCRYALTNRKVNHLMFIVYLKHVASGHIKYNPALLKLWAVDLELSTRTIQNLLKWLIKNKWITVNSKSNSYRVKSYLEICKSLSLNSKTAAIYEPIDFSTFLGFCCAVVIKYVMIKKAYGERKRRSVSQMAYTSKSRYSQPRGYSTLPIQYLAKSLSITSSTANNYKRKAVKSGYLTVKKRTEIMLDDKGNKISRDSFVVFAKNDPTIVGRLRRGRKYLKQVAPDLLCPNVIIKRKSYKSQKKSKQ